MLDIILGLYLVGAVLTSLLIVSVRMSSPPAPTLYDKFLIFYKGLGSSLFWFIFIPYLIKSLKDFKK